MSRRKKKTLKSNAKSSKIAAVVLAVVLVILLVVRDLALIGMLDAHCTLFFNDKTFGVEAVNSRTYFLLKVSSLNWQC